MDDGRPNFSFSYTISIHFYSITGIIGNIEQNQTKQQNYVNIIRNIQKQ